MRFNICTNLDNGVGLERDYWVLRRLLESWGHQVTGVHYKKQNQIEEAPRADVNIFLEVIQYGLVGKAPKNWLVPNPEWFCKEDHQNDLRPITKILCKTKDSVRIFSELYSTLPVEYMGFESEDLYDETIPRLRKFIHVAGQSRYKNSKGVAYAFAKFFDDPGDKANHKELVFVGAYPVEVEFARDHKNVQYIQRATPAEMKKLLNECLFHIMPSGYEGWGHALHEGFGVGNVVITTNFPPMNEFGADQDLLIEPQNHKPELTAQMAFVGAYQIKSMIDKVWSLTPERIAGIQLRAREYFLRQRADFRAKFKSIVEAS